MHCHSLSRNNNKKREKKNKLVDWSVGGTWHKSVNSCCLYCITGEWCPWWCRVKRNRLGTAFWWWWWRAKLLTVGMAGRVEGGGRTSLVLMMGHWTSPLQILYITPRREVFLRCSINGHPSESSMRFTLEVLWYRFNMNRAARLWTASNLSMLFWMYLVWVLYWWSIFKYGCDKGLVCSVLYGTGANLQIVPPKTKCPPSLVCYIVNHIGYPSPYFAGDAKESPLKRSVIGAWLLSFAGQNRWATVCYN